MTDREKFSLPAPTERQQVRLMIWATPRSISTALTKCLSFVQDSKGFFEGYTVAYHEDPEGGPPSSEEAGRNIAREEKVEGDTVFDPRFDRESDKSRFTYQWMKEQLEGTHDDKKFVLCKDMAYAVSGHYAFLPENYQHLFLIRNPLKIFPSWKAMIKRVLGHSMGEFDKLPPRVVPPSQGYKDLNDLMEYLKESQDREAIIIDADDLLQDPKGILSAVFKVLGMSFEERLLSWEASDAVTEEWAIPKQLQKINQIGELYKTAFTSTCFTKPQPVADRSSDLTPDLLRCVDAAMPFYDKMHARRLTTSK